MSLFGVLNDFLKRYFGWRREEPKEFMPEPLEESVEQLSRHADGHKVIDVNLFTTEKLYARNGKIPEQMAARFIENAFSAENTSYGYDVSYNFETVTVSREQAVCGDDSVYSEWAEMVNSDIIDDASDTNILLTDANGGGCGAIGGNVAVAGARAIDKLKFVQDRGSGEWFDNMAGILHELGHNLSLSHDMDDEKNGYQHTGVGWNEDGKWHRTPMNVANGTTNICGELVKERKNDATVQELLYHDCSIKNFEVTDE